MANPINGYRIEGVRRLNHREVEVWQILAYPLCPTHRVMEEGPIKLIIWETPRNYIEIHNWGISIWICDGLLALPSFCHL